MDDHQGVALIQKPCRKRDPEFHRRQRQAAGISAIFQCRLVPGLDLAAAFAVFAFAFQFFKQTREQVVFNLLPIMGRVLIGPVTIEFANIKGIAPRDPGNVFND